MIKEFLNELKTIKPSIWFWNILVVIAWLSTAFINVEYTLIIWVASSILSIFVIEDDHSNKHLWVYTSFLIWLILIVGLILWLSCVIEDKLITPFNNWINVKFSNKQK